MTTVLRRGCSNYKFHYLNREPLRNLTDRRLKE